MNQPESTLMDPIPALDNAPDAAIEAIEVAEAAEATEQPRVRLQMPVDVRSISLVVLATLASIFMLRWASAFFIPVLVGLLLSYLLSPVVDWLDRYRVPRVLSAAVLILAILTGVGGTAYTLSDDASRLVESLPVAVKKLGESIRLSVSRQTGKTDNPLATMQKAASALQQAAEETTRPEPIGRGVQRVQIEKPKFHINDYLWNGTVGLLTMLGEIGMVALITFFLVVSGDRFRLKVVRLAGPTLSRRKITLQALNEINSQIQRYMLVQLFTSILTGVLTWVCFLLIGVENPAVWGVAAGVLNLIPYIGSVIITAGSALVSFLQFGTLEMAALVGIVSLVIHIVEGFLLTPWLTSRANKMNPVAVFIGVLAWGWLWGVFGLLLGVPIMVVAKSICDRIDDLNPIGELLGD
jgi:predicted PurR-regulated permease PerM